MIQQNEDQKAKRSTSYKDQPLQQTQELSKDDSDNDSIKSKYIRTKTWTADPVSPGPVPATCCAHDGNSGNIIDRKLADFNDNELKEQRI